MPCHHSDCVSSSGERRQKLGQQADTIIQRGGCAPGPDILQPGPPHQIRPDLGDDGDGFSFNRNIKKPGTGRALPEQAVEPAEIAHLRFGHQQQSGQILLYHRPLRPRSSHFELDAWKTAFQSLSHSAGPSSPTAPLDAAPQQSCRNRVLPTCLSLLVGTKRCFCCRFQLVYHVFRHLPDVRTGRCHAWTERDPGLQGKAQDGRIGSTDADRTPFVHHRQRGR